MVPAFTAGSFAASFDLTITTTSNGISTMDYDGDGKVDMLVDNNGIVSAFRNIGNTGTIDASTFATPYQVTTQGQNIKGVDVDGDGKPDLTTTSLVFRNISDGAVPNPIIFEPQVTRDNGSAGHFGPSRDLNKDGKVDVIYTAGAGNIFYVENQSRQGGFVGIGNTLATFATYTTQPKPSQFGYCTVADFDGDGFNDIVATNPPNDNFTAYLSAGLTGGLSATSFNTGTTFATGDTPNGVAAFDFDGDGKIDVAVANSVNNVVNTISVYRKYFDTEQYQLPATRFCGGSQRHEIWLLPMSMGTANPISLLRMSMPTHFPFSETPAQRAFLTQAHSPS